jgi:hypothetical protein
MFFNYTVTHRAGSYVAGVWTAGATTTETIKANVQPASAWQMRSLPEGRQELAGILIITPTQLRTLKDSPVNQSPDLLAYDGASWELVQQEPFSALTLTEAHYEYIATRLT